MLDHECDGEGGHELTHQILNENQGAVLNA